MHAFIMLSAAALVAAQPVPRSEGLVGPIQEAKPIIEEDESEDYVDKELGTRPVVLDLPDVADGAQIRLRGAKLKLKVPI